MMNETLTERSGNASRLGNSSPAVFARSFWRICRNLLGALLLVGTVAHADDTPDAKPAEEAVPFAKQQFKPPTGLRRVFKDHDIWIDTKRKRVIMDGVVTLREGQLEMFACPRQTKEHESVVAVNCLAKEAHAGLILVGARSGSPAQFQPKYTPATGSVIDITVLWHDKEGKKRSTRAQEWVRNVKTGKAMKYDWVFAGSGFWVDPDNGDRFYHGDSGDFICVSNFPSATLDLPVESSQANSSLLFESFTENIPAKGTPVRLVLTPRPPKKAEPVVDNPAPATDKQDAVKKKGDAGKKATGKKDTGKKDAGKKDAGKKDAGKKDAGKKDAGRN